MSSNPLHLQLFYVSVIAINWFLLLLNTQDVDSCKEFAKNSVDTVDPNTNKYLHPEYLHLLHFMDRILVVEGGNGF